MFSSFLFLWFVSSFMPLKSKKILEIISILLNSLKFVSCPSTWSILENAPYDLEKHLYSDFFFYCNVLKISIKSSSSVLSFRISAALLIFCLEDLSIDVSEGLMSPIIIFSSISTFMSVSICFIYLSAPVLGTYMLMSLIFSSSIDPYIIVRELPLWFRQ